MSQYISELNKITERLIDFQSRTADMANRQWKDHWTRNESEVKQITVDGKTAVLLS